LSIGAIAVFLHQTPASPTLTTAEAAPSQAAPVLIPVPTTITLRATVTPADARILVDGRDLGAAGDAIVLAREKKEHAVRIERKGYESQTMWVTGDADKQLGPVTLVALAAAPVASASASNTKIGPVPSGKPTTTKKTVNKDLYKPKELGGTKK
jgi:hypothetical protein